MQNVSAGEKVGDRSRKTGDRRKTTFGYSDDRMFRMESGDRSRKTGSKASVRRGAFALGLSDAQGSEGLVSEGEESMAVNAQSFDGSGSEELGERRREEGDIRIFGRSDVQKGVERSKTGDRRRKEGVGTARGICAGAVRRRKG